MAEDLKTIDTLDLSPFKKLVMTIGELPTSFVESMTYYEALAWLVNYMENEVIPTVNNNAEAVEELQTAFITLKEFVDNYFDNLDVQEEINNKLDDMATSGELEEIIINYLSGTVDIIFPDYGKDGTDTLGDCSIIKTANKSVMIDCFADDATCWGRITEALYQNGITKLDYFIVTHYDGDHYGNYQRLIASGLISDARIILPRSVVQGDINKTGNDIKSALTTAGLTYETADNETLNIDNYVTLKLFNASAADYAYYDAIPETNYNNYSICAELECYGKKVLFTGDILEHGEDYIAKNYISSGYELVKDSHHGFNAFVNEYGRKAAPKYVLVPASNGMIMKNLGYRGNIMLANWSEYTPFVYITGIQNTFVRFTVGNGETKVNEGTVATQEAMGGNGNYTYVIDYDNADELRIGSSEHPFKTLAEASLLTPKNTNKNINIQIASLGEETTQVNFAGYTQLAINFNSHAPKHLITFNEIHDLRLTNVSLTDSVIEINDCSGVINGLSSTYTTTNQISLARSKFHFTGSLTSSGATSSFINATYSNLTFSISGLTFTSDDTNRILGGYGNTYVMTTASVTLFNNYKFLSEVITSANAKQCIFNALEDLCTLFNDTATSSTILPKENQKLYSRLKITFITSDSRRMIQECVANNNSSFFISTPSSNGSELYVVSCIVDAYTANSISFSRNFGLTIATTGTTATSTTLKISKVVGII